MKEIDLHLMSDMPRYYAFFAQKIFDKCLFCYRGRNILDDFREAYYWLWQNTADNATVMSWWDYGYQIAGMANRTTLVDNNTWNNSHIALVGKAMSSNESRAYEIMTELVKINFLVTS